MRPAVDFSRVLGLPAATAAGLSVSVPLGVLVVSGEVLRLSGDEAPFAFLLAGLLYLPLLLGYAERSCELHGSASVYKVARASGSAKGLFFAGWLLLGGYSTVTALLAWGVAYRLEVGFQLLFGARYETGVLALAVLGGFTLHNLLSFRRSWRRQAILLWGALVALAAMTAWGFTRPASNLGMEIDVDSQRHWLASVALLGAGLWGLELILDLRGQLRQPSKTLPRALLVAWLPVALLGAPAAFLVLRHSEILTDRESFLSQVSWDENRLVLLLNVTTVLLCGLGLQRALERGVRVVRAMARDGLLPRWLVSLEGLGALRRPLFFFFLFAALCTALPRLDLAGVASFLALLTGFLVLWPHLRRPAGELSSGRRPRLPLHPLVPGLAAASAVFFALILPRTSLALGLGWGLLGGLVFWTYARHRVVALHQRTYLVDRGGRGEVDPDEPEVYRVLASVGGEPAATASLIRLGTALARSRGGELLVLQVVPLDEKVPLDEIRETAAEVWQDLEKLIGSARKDETPVRPLVRIAPSPNAGILATAAENRVDFLLLGWPAAGVEGEHEAVVEEVFPATHRSVAVLHSLLPDTAEEVMVATAGGPHAPVALELGEALAAVYDARLTVLGVDARGAEREAREAVAKTRTARPGPAEPLVVDAVDAAQGILHSAAGTDVLLLGASVDRLLQRTVLGGLPAEVAAGREAATVVVKRAERVSGYWLRRLWELVSSPLPTLSVRERSEVFAQMRQSARAGVDYYVLIFLASAIASLGLILDSGAVIIGAMLVAPLMSPILAVGQGIVQGNVRLIRRGASSAFKGVAVALAVGTASALLLPPRPPTHEMLARGEPSLLDLLVAVMAGAAAAYGVSRKSVAAALPGVAISVALVPPLCVAGWGLGSSNFRLGGGALLLFLTNFAGIVLVGALIFLLLGFRPSRTGRDRAARRAILWAAVAIVLVAIPLGFQTRTSIQTHRLEALILSQLRRADQELRVENLSVQSWGDELVVEGTIYTDEELDPERFETARQRLEAAAGMPVRLRLTLVEASFEELGPP